MKDKLNFIFFTAAIIINSIIIDCTGGGINVNNTTTDGNTDQSVYNNNNNNNITNPGTPPLDWTHIAEDQLNKDVKKSARNPQLTEFNSKLYCIWDETGTKSTQIRVRVFNGDYSAQEWQFVDGNGINGINKDINQDAEQGQLIVRDNKLYAIWAETVIDDEYREKGQIRVCVYNGDDISPQWTFIDEDGQFGLNKNYKNSASSPQLQIFNSKLYATWNEYKNTSKQIRTCVYNGNDSNPEWNFVDGDGEFGINKNIGFSGCNPFLFEFDLKLYAIWEEKNGIAVQIHVCLYNGDDLSPIWTFVDGNGSSGINYNSDNDANNPSLSIFDSKLYATWEEYNDSMPQIRVSLYNDNDIDPQWSFVDGNTATGLNINTEMNALNPQLINFNSAFYILWTENNEQSFQVRASKYNGDDSSPIWNIVDGSNARGLNKFWIKNANNPRLTIFDSRIFACWYESFGTTNVIQVIYGE